MEEATALPEELKAGIRQALGPKLLGMAPERTNGAYIALGYPADARARRYSDDPSVLRRPIAVGRKPLSEFVSWERYGRRER